MQLTDKVFEVIKNILPNGGKILELGSGYGTKKLIDLGFSVSSIEQNEDWQFKFHENYICCPIKKYDNYHWFDSDKLFPFSGYDLLIIDGPTGPPTEEFYSCRVGFLDFKHLFDLSAPIIVDDTNRYHEKLIAENLCVGKSYKDYGNFYVIY